MYPCTQKSLHMATLRLCKHIKRLLPHANNRMASGDYSRLQISKSVFFLQNSVSKILSSHNRIILLRNLLTVRRNCINLTAESIPSTQNFLRHQNFSPSKISVSQMPCLPHFYRRGSMPAGFRNILCGKKAPRPLP